MPAVAAFALDANGAEGQSQVVDYYKNILNRNVFLLFPIANGVSAEVHICGRFEQNELLVLHSHFSHIAVTLSGKRSIGCLGKGIQYSKSYVVASALIFATNVAQAYNKKFHY